ncbi:MAG TPA: dTDP-4-dehydrorhamnose 3,5-epimerase [Candidatus Krumholzibacteria bacterium]|nr:dTDP-4-dehydrorhamnose 3,5-epimerase [Candidatus Krumholzibacteria bacterium]HRX50352.1 dTDP-4-dehydrorhamnose 3,5-epimerase [Candidatus Krumholzibacteria bacterium]
MNVIKTDLSDVLIVEPRVFQDDRGFFFESWNAARWREATGLDTSFVQDNHSSSRLGVVRGLHYQVRHVQGKLVRVVRGEIYDVALDLRRSSPDFGRWTGARLSAGNRRQLWIPAGFAHAFMALTDDAEVLYKTTDVYDREAERSILWDDPDLGIDWPLPSASVLSDKDRAGVPFRDAETFA